jgi:MoxR-like ATPase
VIQLALIALLARGHLLIEDVPGVGKTTLAQALARSFHCSFQRIQFTSDLLPSDVIGISVYNPATQEFEFKPGPIFANIIVADEINRTTPKTQSALLEAMSESQVTVDNHTHPLPKPFMVLATQNPIEHHGTYPLPESQLDRFLMRIRMGYPARASEKEIIRNNSAASAIDLIEPTMDAADVVAAQESVSRVKCDDSLLDYALEIVERTRQPARRRDAASRRAGPRLSGRPRLLPTRRFQAPDRPRLRPPRGGQLALRLHAETLRAGRSHPGRNDRLDPRPALGRCCSTLHASGHGFSRAETARR